MIKQISENQFSIELNGSLILLSGKELIKLIDNKKV